jgi:hypothetical protein
MLYMFVDYTKVNLKQLQSHEDLLKEAMDSEKNIRINGGGNMINPLPNNGISVPTTEYTVPKFGDTVPKVKRP